MDPKDLKQLGLFTTEEAKMAGVSRSTLFRLVKNGAIIRVANGYFHHPDILKDPQIEGFALACKKFGANSIICGPSALHYWNLIDSPPAHTWVMTNENKVNRNEEFKLIRSKLDTTISIKRYRFYCISNVERSIVECLYMSTKLGKLTGIQSARIALSEGLTSLKKINEVARRLNLTRAIELNWEAIIAE